MTLMCKLQHLPVNRPQLGSARPWDPERICGYYMKTVVNVRQLTLANLRLYDMLIQTEMAPPVLGMHRILGV